MINAGPFFATIENFKTFADTLPGFFKLFFKKSSYLLFFLLKRRRLIFLLGRYQLILAAA